MLKNISTEVLQAELNRRKDTEAAIPKQLPSLDFTPLQKICQDYIDALEIAGYANEEYPHSIYETAMECIFGKDVFVWINLVKE